MGFIEAIVLVKRVKDVFHLNGYRISADRRASDGYGVLVVVESSKLDKDFEVALGEGKRCFFITTEQYRELGKQLDLSNFLTRDHLRKGKGFGGERPLSDLM